jgi:hypothetical protein
LRKIYRCVCLDGHYQRGKRISPVKSLKGNEQLFSHEYGDIYDEEVKKSARSEERRTKKNLIFHFRLFWASILDMPSPDSVSPRSLHFFRWPTRSVQLSPPLTPILASRNESLVPVQVRRPLFGRHDDVCIILVSFVFV